MRVPAVAVVLILGFAARLQAATPLLRVSQDGYDLASVPVVTFGFDVFIYSDRLTVEDSRLNNLHTLSRATARRSEFKALNRALSDAGAGVATNCEFGDPRLDRGRTTTWRITWFGRAGRSNTFTVRRSFDAHGEPCPFAIRELLDALSRYTAAARSAPDAVQVPYDTP